MLSHNLSKQKGIGLFEIMLVLLVVALILMMSIRYYRSTRTSQNAAATIAIVGDIHNASMKYAKRNDFTGLSLSMLKDAGLLSRQQTVSPWDGSEIVVSSINNNQQAQIAVAGIPEGTCITISDSLKNTTRSTSEDASCSGTTLTVKYDLF